MAVLNELGAHYFVRVMKKKVITGLTDYQENAEFQLSSDVYSYFVSGSDDEVTLRNNVTAFTQIYLAPRVLVDMSQLSMNSKVLGHQLALPFGIAPFAMQKMLHPMGELITARQAYEHKTAYGLSMLTTTKPNQVAKVNPSGLKMLQLYFMKNAEYTKDVLRLAQQNGFHAFAITVDTQTFGKRRGGQRTQSKLPVTLQLFKELGYDFAFRDYENTEKSFVHQIRHDISWEDIKWIKENSSLKIVLKGIISPEDVPIADKYGVDAIWISNHGGRQLDTAPATILALPSIRRKVNQIGSKMEIYIDGGVRTGSDIFKCLALGADFVFLGRGFLFSVNEGEKGVKNAFDILINELRTTMMLCGTPSIKSITSEYILKHPQAKL